MTGTSLYWTKHCKAEFGTYCEVHEEHSPMTKNRIDYAHTHSNICLGTTSKFQGRYTFLCLNIGNHTTRNKFSVVPVTDSVVKRLEELSTIVTQIDKDLTFGDRDNITIEDTNDTSKGAYTLGVELETPGVEVDLGTPGVEIGIITPGVENPNINRERYQDRK